MPGPLPPPAKGPSSSLRPQTRSQGPSSQPTPTATPPQRELTRVTPAHRATRPTTVTRSSPQAKAKEILIAPSNILLPLKTIADGIRLVLDKYNPSDDIRNALREIHGYAKRASEEEEARTNKDLDKAKELEDKLTKSIELLTKSSERIEAAANDINGKLTAVANTSSQLESTVNTYKDALLKAPAKATYPGEERGDVDPAIGLRAERKQRQVIIDFPDDQMTSLSDTTIIEKVKNAIKEVPSPSPPDDANVEEITKLRNNGVMVLLNSKELVEWLKDTEVELLFTSALATGATIRARQYTILVPKIPLTLDPNSDAHIREIEENNRLKKFSLSKIRWIKPESRRRPDQRLAHAFFSLNSAEAANICIRDGILVHGVKTFPSKSKQEPTQCLKCRNWGHFANQCMATKDTCGTCGGDHWTNACSESTKRYCAPCSSVSHASWDRQCPIFLRRCAEFDETHPENALKYFPTDEPWSKVIRPAKLPFTERFPARFAVGSLPPPPTRENTREPPTRQINTRRRRHPPQRANKQTSIADFYGPSGSQTRGDNFTADIGEEGEVLTNNAENSFSFSQPQDISPWI
jgi:hypothetical protein